MTKPMTDQETARDVASQIAWTHYEEGMCQRGAGCTRQQMVGAAIALEWVKDRIAHALAAEREACVKIVNGWREEDPPEDISSELWKYIGHILDKKADAIRTRGR